QLLLLAPSALQSNSISFQPELPPPPKYLNNLIEDVIKERPAETLLLLKRRLDVNCSMEELNSIPIPTIRLDEVTKIEMKRFINAKILSVVCMSKIDDIQLLTLLAKDLHRIRQSRIIILLQITQSNPKEFLENIQHQASKFGFVSVLVIHLNALNIKKRFVTYRLQPFPTSTLIRVSNLRSGPIFPNIETNFQNKTVLALVNPFPPTSFLLKDKKSGKNVLSGYMDKMLIEFAKKHNINLQMPITNSIHPDNEVIELILNKSYELTTHLRILSMNVEYTHYIGILHTFFIVPCGQKITLSDLFKNLRFFIIIMCFTYIVFAIIETLIRTTACRIFGERQQIRFSTFFINLNAVRGVLGQSINLFGNRSISMHQFVMIMSIYSIIMTCLFNANLSTLLTMPLEKNYISNFEELRESGLPILFDNIFGRAVENDIRRGFVNLSLDQTFFIKNDERLEMVLARNLQNVYFMNNEAWNAFHKYLTNDKNHVFCNPSDLHFIMDTSIHGVLPYNSIYLNALNHFILRVQENGIKKHWVSESYEKMLTNMNHSQKIFYPNPLTYRDLQWVWELLGICYAVSILVFIGEL
ncbi:hypothetical protein KR215_003699, partial [Drosophila sulfurigaster]